MQQEVSKEVKSESEIILERYKVQYLDLSKREWREFGTPVLSLTEEGALKYFEEYRHFLESKARIVKVTEQVLRHLCGASKNHLVAQRGVYDTLAFKFAKPWHGLPRERFSDWTV